MHLPSRRSLLRPLQIASAIVLAFITGYLVGIERPSVRPVLQLHDIEDRHCLERLNERLAAWPSCAR